ncbi:MAG TPA: trypsin-like peptidase domain-containing protein [Gemmatimonadaceae bacterium]|nr:trypsin-like peptidase domain-containing protein [Gemmatimonadaceae bacterium]
MGSRFLIPLPLLAAVLAACQGASPADSLAQSVPQVASTAPQAVSASRRNAITEAVARVAPAVVTVQTEVVERVPVDPFDWITGRQSGERIGAGLGSGFITDPNGTIVTNAHVVSGATRVSVAMRDGKTFPAKVLGVDEQNDLAVLKIDARNLPVAPLGSSDDIIIGEWAIAIGNPYGFLLGNTEPSVTAGVVSATGRNLIGQVEGGGAYVDMIQTDASINPGNSGGPLVNADGVVIGVNASIYSPSGGSVGLGFAIPINRAKRVTEDLVKHGRLRQPWIGVKVVQPNTNNPREALNAGVIVSAIVPGSPAARAGIQPGDQLVSAGPRRLKNAFDWEAERLDLRVGDRVPMVIRRNGRDQTLSVEIMDLPEVSAPKVAVLQEMELITLTPAIRVERGVRAARGAVVYNVSARVSNDIGIQRGDVIVQINRLPVASASDVQKAIDTYAGRSAIRIVYERGGQIYYTDVVIQ